MSIFTEEDRAQLNTPAARLGTMSQFVKVLVGEIGLTQEDIDTCRAETRMIADAMIRSHVTHKDAGKAIDDVRARCDMLDAVMKYVRRGE